MKEVFIGVLALCGPLATKYMSLNNVPCMTIPTIIDLSF